MNALATQTISLVENGEGEVVRLNDQAKNLLDRHNRFWRSNLGLNREPFIHDEGRLYARDVTGFVNLGDLAVEIAPKFLTPAGGDDEQWRRALWAILARIYRTPVLSSSTLGSVTPSNFLPDLLGMVLLGSMIASKPNGRPMGYSTEQGRLRHFQGRLDLGRIVEILAYPGEVPCEYDVYSEDVPTNRLLRWAAEQLASQVRSVRLSHDLWEESVAIKTLSPFPPSLGDAERINLPPHHASLLPAVTVGQLLLMGRGLQHGGGNQELPGFLWKSSEVFERFVWYLIHRVARTRLAGVRVAGQRVKLAAPVIQGGQTLWTVPDVRLEGTARTLGVFDAKYKVWQSQPLASDTYQVVTGAWTRNCPIACLVYPSPEGVDKDPIEWRLLGPGNPKSLWALFINLAEIGDPVKERALEQQVASDLSVMMS